MYRSGSKEATGGGAAPLRQGLRFLGADVREEDATTQTAPTAATRRRTLKLLIALDSCS